MLWMQLADPWEVLADGVHYLRMYEGKVADRPFGYRLLAPTLA